MALIPRSKVKSHVQQNDVTAGLLSKLLDPTLLSEKCTVLSKNLAQSKKVMFKKILCFLKNVLVYFLSNRRNSCFLLSKYTQIKNLNYSL